MELHDTITDGQRFALNKLVGGVAKDRHCRLFVIGDLLGRKIETTATLTVGDWRQIRNMAYNNWGAGDWTPTAEFIGKCRGIAEKYEVEVVGQKLLF